MTSVVFTVGGTNYVTVTAVHTRSFTSCVDIVETLQRYEQCIYAHERTRIFKSKTVISNEMLKILIFFLINN